MQEEFQIFIAEEWLGQSPIGWVNHKALINGYFGTVTRQDLVTMIRQTERSNQFPDGIGSTNMTTSDEPQGCLTAILKLFGISLGRSTEPSPLPYGLRDDFLSPAELSFCRVLQQVGGDRAGVCPKVNLADLFYVKRARENRGARNKIDR